jgi:hypothetical protein
MSGSEAAFYLETRLGKIPKHPQAEEPEETSKGSPEELT